LNLLVAKNICLISVPYFIEKKIANNMAHWLALEHAARHYAANTPGFLAGQYVIDVQLAGGPYAYVISLGYNVNTQQGEEAVNFHVALHNFCLVRCMMDLGWVPYHPAPLIGVPPPILPEGGEGAAVQQPIPPNQQNADAAPAEEQPEAQGQQPPLIPNIDEEAEADQMLHVVMLD
jgi:hypothetical protein